MKLIKILAMLVVVICVGVGCSITSHRGEGKGYTKLNIMMMDVNVFITDDGYPRQRVYPKVWTSYDSEWFWIENTKRMYGSGRGHHHYRPSPPPPPPTPTASYWETPSPWGGRPSAGPGQPYR